MSKTLKVKLGALGASSLLLVGVAVAAIGLTGAYFSETKAGEFKGNIGSIHVNTSGGDGPNGLEFAFHNMLPGELQTAHIEFENSGANNEAVYIVFQNETALSALNNLGEYGEAYLSADGKGLFGSKNLNDKSSTCPLGSHDSEHPNPCNPLVKQYKLVSDLAPGARGNASFSFAYSGKLKGEPGVGETAPFNTYPVAGQVHVNAADGEGTGLPYEIVATQVGQEP